MVAPLHSQIYNEMKILKANIYSVVILFVFVFGCMVWMQVVVTVVADCVDAVLPIFSL